MYDRGHRRSIGRTGVPSSDNTCATQRGSAPEAARGREARRPAASWGCCLSGSPASPLTAACGPASRGQEAGWHSASGPVRATLCERGAAEGRARAWTQWEADLETGQGSPGWSQTSFGICDSFLPFHFSLFGTGISARYLSRRSRGSVPWRVTPGASPTPHSDHVLGEIRDFRANATEMRFGA